MLRTGATAPSTERSPPCADSGDEEPKPDICHLEVAKLAVALGPATRGEVVTEASHRPVFAAWNECVPQRDSTADALIEIGLGPAPVGLVEAINAIPGNQHGLDPSPNRISQLDDRRTAGQEVRKLREVVARQPELTKRIVVSPKHHDALSDAPKL